MAEIESIKKTACVLLLYCVASIIFLREKIIEQPKPATNRTVNTAMKSIRTPEKIVEQPRPPTNRTVNTVMKPTRRKRKKNRERTDVYQSSLRRRKDRKIMYYLHIHKGGGTTMCQQAYKEQLRIKRQTNCNVQADQHCCGNEDSLEAQIWYAKTTQFDFVACEKEMYDTMTTDYYDYVVTLRDSATRYVSHWNHLRTNSRLNPLYSKNTSTNKTPKIQMNDTHDMHIIIKNKKQYSVGNFATWWELQPDNYNTRMICGAKCLDHPKFQITPQLFQYTLQRLSLFSHVLFLEDMESSYTAFTKAVGWTRAVNVVRKNAKMSTSNKTISEKMAENKLRYDPFMTVLDDALYAFARKRYEGNYTSDIEIASLVNEYANSTNVQDYYRDGRSRNCKDPCCGECSKWR